MPHLMMGVSDNGRTEIRFSQMEKHLGTFNATTIRRIGCQPMQEKHTNKAARIAIAISTQPICG